MVTSRDKEILTWIENYKSITISQCTELFFNHNYEGCRRRLKQLEEMGFINNYKTEISKEKVYYRDKKLKDHDLLVYDFIKKIKKEGGNLIKLQLQPSYLNKKIRPDAFIIFEFNDNVYFIILEVDLNHYTSNSKMQKYELLYKSGELKELCYGTFPIVIISRPTQGIRYNSANFSVIYTDLSYSNLNNLLLHNTIIS